MSVKQIRASLLRNRLQLLGLAAILTVVALITTGAEGGTAGADVKYVGVDKCKTCHEAKEKGNQYHAWKETKHAKAYVTLGSDKAKEMGKKVGVENPQTDAKCLVCHETGYGEPKEKFAKSFVDKQGVQCETCHGPGEKHVKARFDAAANDNGGGGDGFGFEEEGGGDGPALQKLGEGEIVISKDDSTCVKCHNEKSPSFSGKFDFAEMAKKIPHPDPRKHKKAE